MNGHDKGMRLSQKVLNLQPKGRAHHMRHATPKGKRLARRMLRCWARYWELSGSIDLARTMRNDAKNLR
jgi:hypothetical protein